MCLSIAFFGKPGAGVQKELDMADLEDTDVGRCVLSPGKVPSHLLETLLNLPRKTVPEVMVGPGLGEDAAVIRLPMDTIVVTSDPITFKTPRPGYYAVHINANDIAVMGARPKYFTLSILMPPGSEFGRIEAVMKDAIEAGDALGAVLIGGHSEVTAGVNTPLVSITMIGGLSGWRPFLTGDGSPGDVILQVNPMAVEGTSILAAEHREVLVKELGRDLVERAAGFLYDPGISVVEAAGLLADNCDVRAMHDPTEGGLATGLKEVAQASGTGLLIRRDRLVAAVETRAVCRVLGYDPLGLISSGCLICTLSEQEAPRAVRQLTAAGFQSAEIGCLTGRRGEYLMENSSGERAPLPVFDVDELAKA